MLILTLRSLSHPESARESALRDGVITLPWRRYALITNAGYLDSMTHVVQHAVVDRLADVAHGPLGIGWGNDLVRAGRVLVGGEDANLSPGHLFFVDVHRLEERKKNRDISMHFTFQIPP